VRWGVVTFPGSNDDRDTVRAIARILGDEAVSLWHKDEDLQGVDCVVLPGGFSYGDYLRCGAIARFSPVMRAVARHAEAGGLVLGICNGFQILCEAGLLPGALLRNEKLKYICKPVDLEIVNGNTRFTAGFGERRTARMTIGNGEGNFFADEETLDRIEGEGQVVFRYAGENPNGSARSIAGIVNAGGNVLGMMPHPDRAFEAELGSADGGILFKSVLG